MSGQTVQCGDCPHVWESRSYGLPARCPSCSSRRVSVYERPQRTGGGGNAFGCFLCIIAVGASAVVGVFVLALCLPRENHATPKSTPTLAVVVEPEVQPRTQKRTAPDEVTDDWAKQPPKVPLAPPPGQPPTKPIEPFQESEAKVELALTPATLRIGQIGEFKKGTSGGAMPGTVLAVLDAESLVVRTKDRDLILTGVRTDNQVADKGIWLRGKWEVIGERRYKGREVYELASLVEDAAVEEQAKKATTTTTEKAPKPASSVLTPIVPTREQIAKQGGPKTQHVSGYYRSNGTYVAPYTRSGGGGRR